MDERSRIVISLPSAAQIRLAVRTFLEPAYAGAEAGPATKFVPPKNADPVNWLMADPVERDPPGAPLESVRSFALRIGNSQYPHMKLRISRPPADLVFLFSVDCHDAFLRADPGSADHEALEALKRHNAVIAAAILDAWEAADLPTERDYLRQKIRQAKAGKVGPAPEQA